MYFNLLEFEVYMISTTFEMLNNTAFTMVLNTNLIVIMVINVKSINYSLSVIPGTKESIDFCSDL